MFFESEKKYLDQIDNYDILLVPDMHISNWKEEYSNTNIEVLTIDQFLNKEANYTTTKKVILLSIFGYGYPCKMIQSLMNTPHGYLFLTYPEEKNDLDGLKQKHENGLTEEYASKDRIDLCKIEFKTRIESVKISELIEKVRKGDDGQVRTYDYDTVDIDYQIKFEEENEPAAFEGSKTVLLEKDGNKRKERISNLRPMIESLSISMNQKKDCMK